MRFYETNVGGHNIIFARVQNPVGALLQFDLGKKS
jgi:hypothetical protein